MRSKVSLTCTSLSNASRPTWGKYVTHVTCACSVHCPSLFTPRQRPSSSTAETTWDDSVARKSTLGRTLRSQLYTSVPVTTIIVVVVVVVVVARHGPIREHYLSALTTARYASMYTCSCNERKRKWITVRVGIGAKVIIVPHWIIWSWYTGWAVTFGTARMELGGAAARSGPSSLY